METLIYLAKSIGILSTFYILYYILLRRNTLFTANRHYLMAGIILAVTLPFLEFTKIVYVSPISPSDITITQSLPITDFQAVIPVAPELSIDWWQVALWVYCVGASILLLRLLIQIISLRRMVQSGTYLKKGGYTYVEVTEDILPFSFFLYIIYNPRLHTHEELEMILAHERVHASQWHSMDMLLTHVVLALQWCNPLAWIYKRSLEQNLEYIADSHAIQQVNNPKQYQRTLVKVSSITYRPALTNQFYQSFIKKRIVMLNTPQTRKQNLWQLSLILPLLAFFMYSFQVKEVVTLQEEDVKSIDNAFAKAETQTPKNQASTAKSESIKTALATMDTPKLNIKKSNKPKTQQLVRIAQNDSLEKIQDFIIPKTKLLMSAQETYRFKITKNTTIEELKALKAMLKEKHGAILKYSGVDFNDEGEITSIRLDFKDAYGNNKNYSIQSDSPIAPIYIYREVDGSTGMGNAGSSAEIEKIRSERLAAMQQRRDTLQAKGSARRNLLKKRRDSLRATVKNRRDSLRSSLSYGANDSMRAVLEERREIMRAKMEERRVAGRARLEELQEERIEELEKRREEINERKEEMNALMSTMREAQNGNDSGSLRLKNGERYYFILKNGKTEFYDQWGEKIREETDIHKKLRESLSGSGND